AENIAVEWVPPAFRRTVFANSNIKCAAASDGWFGPVGHKWRRFFDNLKQWAAAAAAADDDDAAAADGSRFFGYAAGGGLAPALTGEFRTSDVSLDSRYSRGATTSEPANVRFSSIGLFPPPSLSGISSMFKKESSESSPFEHEFTLTPETL